VTLFARRLGPLLLALVVVAGLTVAPTGATDVRAATPDLTIVSDARYDVQPTQSRVRVTVTLRVTNHLKDTATKRYYFDEAFLAVLPGATGMRLTGAGSPGVSVNRRTANATILRLKLGSRLFSGKSATYTLRFDLVDGGGAATRDLRIGTSLVSFPVWAYASDATPGSTVTVVFPAGFETTVEAGDLPAPTKDSNGKVIYRTGRLATPLTFFAYLVADRPGAYAEKALKATVNGEAVPLLIRGWADDAPWSKRVGTLVQKALPVLGEGIGLAWPRDDTLVVQESVSRSTGGYAGLFDPNSGLVEVAYYADDGVVLHEAAHGWFNGSLLADRWSNEAFASYYGEAAAKALKVKATTNELTAALKKSAIPLNAWGPVGHEVAAIEDYGYAASLVVARAIAERAGEDGLRAVWQDAAERVGAYQPPIAASATTTSAEPELVAGPPDWRVLLDLLEARTPASYDDLWRTWIAREEDLPLLDDRATARAEYEAIVAKAVDWELPRPIRDAMRAWRFDDATALLDDASVVLDSRADIEAAAEAAGLVAPATLRDTFQGTDGFGDALDEAAAESAAIDQYVTAAEARPVAPDLVTQVGLWGSTPEVELARARTAFAAGDLEATASAADAAKSIWSTAGDVGQGRVVSIVAIGLAFLVALTLVAMSLRSRRHRRREVAYAASMSLPVKRAMAHPIDPSAPRSYATLAATPDEPPSAAARDASDTGAGPG